MGRSLINTCRGCGTTDRSQFGMNRARWNGISDLCFACNAARSREDRAKRGRRSSIQSGRHLERDYGITQLEVHDLVEKQQGLCPVCEIKIGEKYVDHDHKTGIIRGILCRECNLGIGQFKENTKTLEQATLYLAKEQRSLDLFSNFLQLSGLRGRKHTLNRRDRGIELKYGLTPQDTYNLLKDQNGLCCLCGDLLTDPKIDHDHLTGAIRGILCLQCNLGLGYFEDSSAICQRAIDYLRKERPKPDLFSILIQFTNLKRRKYSGS